MPRISKVMKNYDKKEIDNNGNVMYTLNGQYHRNDGPAIEYANGSKIWYINGQRHRNDGPAIEYTNGSKIWYLNGRLHRIDGPAIEYSNGSKLWYINGVNYSKREFNNYVKSKKNKCPEYMKC